MAASRVAVYPWFGARSPVIAEGQGPHPRTSYRRGVGLEDAPDNFAISQLLEIVIERSCGNLKSEPTHC
jgi:hypothetical protein